MTAHAGEVAHDVTFSGARARVLLRFTPEGKMVLGEGLSADEVSKELGPLLIAEFGKGYGSMLKRALEAEAGAKNRRDEAERKVKALEADVKRLQDKVREIAAR